MVPVFLACAITFLTVCAFQACHFFIVYWSVTLLVKYVWSLSFFLFCPNCIVNSLLDFDVSKLGFLFIIYAPFLSFYDTFSLTRWCPWSDVPCWCLGATSCTHLHLIVFASNHHAHCTSISDFESGPYTGLQHYCFTPTPKLCCKYWVAAAKVLIPCFLIPIYVNNCWSIEHGWSPVRLLVHPVPNVGSYIGLVHQCSSSWSNNGEAQLFQVITLWSSCIYVLKKFPFSSISLLLLALIWNSLQHFHISRTLLSVLLDYICWSVHRLNQYCHYLSGINMRTLDLYSSPTWSSSEA